ncbi:MAG: zinc ribbon domain-containing protein [SAR202 cluster bacterium]|nr:zinc ribbon domain-containing protein [SAR202 cluster bacterium]
MPACTNCGAPLEQAHRFCGQCGRPVAEAQPSPTPAPAPPFERPASLGSQALPSLVSPSRVLVMVVLSYGLYLFYWMYLTWRHYRDHTGRPVFPVWHALSLIVPVYGLFRTYAHMRSFKELMLQGNVPSTISPGWAVAVILLYSMLEWASFAASGGIPAVTGAVEITREMAIKAMLIDLVGLALVAGLLMQVQGNLNRYWASLGVGRAVVPGISLGEVLFALAGSLFWITALTSIMGQ